MMSSTPQYKAFPIPVIAYNTESEPDDTAELIGIPMDMGVFSFPGAPYDTDPDVIKIAIDLIDNLIEGISAVLNERRIQLRSAILVVMRPSAKILQKRLNEVFYS